MDVVAQWIAAIEVAESIFRCEASARELLAKPPVLGPSMAGGTTMKAILLALAACLLSTAALADQKPSNEEAAKIKDAVSAWGCQGGTFEKETEGTGVLEAEDVKCKDGNYDFRLTSDYKVFAITMD